MQIINIRASIFNVVGLLCITLFYGIIFSTTTVAAGVYHSIPKELLKKRISPTNVTTLQPTSKPFVPEYDPEQQEYVKVHNDLRRTVRMPPLQWDRKLASQAHSWAAERQGDCNFRKHSNGSFKENIYWMQYKEHGPTDVVKKWFAEQSLFDHRTNRCKCQPERNGCECGHYLNIIRKTNKRVGCSSAAYCAHEKGLIVVCNYA